MQPANPLGNVYWGDTHVHTHESFDAKLMGTTLTIEDAYRFARGETLRSDGGEIMQLSRPLDFVAITDHAESFGLRTRCGDSRSQLVRVAQLLRLGDAQPDGLRALPGPSEFEATCR